MSDPSRTGSPSTSAATKVGGDATYYTISQSEFFLGTVMLLNSLRVTGNEGQLVVLDSGQRALLEGHAEVVDVPTEGDPGHAGFDEAVPLPLAQALLTVWD